MTYRSNSYYSPEGANFSSGDRGYAQPNAYYEASANFANEAWGPPAHHHRHSRHSHHSHHVQRAEYNHAPQGYYQQQRYDSGYAQSAYGYQPGYGPQAYRSQRHHMDLYPPQDPRYYSGYATYNEGYQHHHTRRHHHHSNNYYSREHQSYGREQYSHGRSPYMSGNQNFYYGNGDHGGMSSTSMRIAQAGIEVARHMNSSFWCARGVQTALARAGMPEFLGSGDALPMLNPLLRSGKFRVVAENDVRPGDIGIRSWSPETINQYRHRFHGRNLGDIFIVAGIRNGQIIQANDHMDVFNRNNPRYDKHIFLRAV